MYRVKLSDRTVRASILANAKKLKDNPQCVGIFISPDLTYIQRQDRAAKRANRTQAVSADVDLARNVDPLSIYMPDQQVAPAVILTRSSLPVSGNQRTSAQVRGGARTRRGRGGSSQNFQ